jgi:hypothetical protein
MEGGSRGAYRVLLGRPEGKRRRARARRRWGDNIKMDLKALEWEAWSGVDLAQDRYRWRALMNAEVYLLVP